MKKRYVVIMAGGRGERFWPQSRLSRPKQLLPIVGDKPLLTQTVERLGDVAPREHVFVITNQEQAAAVREACPELQPSQIIAEPVGRDTAPAVGLATVLVQHRDPDGVYAMLPADHVIADSEGFQRVLNAAFEAAEREDALVTIGIKPDHPATGYGYLQRGDKVTQAGERAVYAVQRFVEKPELEKAREYLESGDYLWNGGMFIWRASVVAEAFRNYAPELWSGLEKIAAGLREGRPLDAVLAEHYQGLTKISVDYAIMEKARNVLTVQSDFDWDDVGAWPALARHIAADAQGNHTRGNVVTEDASGNIVISEGGHLVAIMGVENCIVVHTPDATLVCPRDKAQDIKKLVKRLGDDERWRKTVE